MDCDGRKAISGNKQRLDCGPRCVERAWLLVFHWPINVGGKFQRPHALLIAWLHLHSGTIGPLPITLQFVISYLFFTAPAVIDQRFDFYCQQD